MGISVGVIGQNDSGYKFYKKQIELFLNEIAHQNPIARSFQLGITEKMDKRLFPEKLTPLELHSLRRYATHIALNAAPPAIPMRTLDRMPILDEIQKGQITLEEFQKILLDPEKSKAAFLSNSNTYQGDSVLENYYLNFHPLKKYAHLISKKDYIGGYYFPIDFAQPIVVNQHSHSEEGMIGSSQRLLTELNELRPYLEMPDLSMVDINAYSNVLNSLSEDDPWIYEKAAWTIFYICAKESVRRNLIMCFG
jgi:hypothetical protein